VAALARRPLILMHSAESVRAVVDAAFLADGRLPIIATEATYMSTAVGMVRAGLGVAILPGSAMEVRAERTLNCALWTIHGSPARCRLSRRWTEPSRLPPRALPARWWKLCKLLKPVFFRRVGTPLWIHDQKPGGVRVEASIDWC
jgi:DNA-binding transcriptional LysR family regulator